MAPHTIPFSARSATPNSEHSIGFSVEDEAQHVALNAEDGTLHLLRSGFLISGVAALCLCLTLWTLGGIGGDGPQTQAGWLTLLIALMCMPFGLLLLLLGGAKWLRNHSLSRTPARSRRADVRGIPTGHSR
jgi:hypothetical protein